MIGKTIRQYEIIEELGQGDFGTVYKAKDKISKRVVALKVLAEDAATDPHAWERFLLEAQAASALNNKRIARIYAIEEAKKQTIISSQLIKGESLKSIIESGRDEPLSIYEILKYAVNVGRALRTAHRNEIVHGGIKPSNIMVTEDVQIKVLDFGLAELRIATRLAGGEPVLASSPYMSPEQIQGGEVDHRTDIWSLGAVLYEMLTGQEPFGGQHVDLVRHAILSYDPTPISVLREGVPPRLVEMVSRMLKKKPDHRYQTMDKVVSKLRQIGRRLDSQEDVIADTSTQEPVAPKRWMVPTAAAVIITSLLTLLFWHRPPATIPSIAVLPVAVASAESKAITLADCLTDALIADLSRLSSVKVISQYSGKQSYREDRQLAGIARRLNVKAVLTGSLERDRSGVRLATEIVIPASNKILFNKSYSCSFEDLLSLQRTVALDVADALRVSPAVVKQARLFDLAAVDSAAIEDYLRGRHLLRMAKQTDLDEAIHHFKAAANHAPDRPLGYLGLAEAYTRQAQQLAAAPVEVLARARQNALAAVSLDSTEVSVRKTLAWSRYLLDCDWDAAKTEFLRTLERDPGDSATRNGYAWYLAAMGSFDDAIEQLRIVLGSDPLSPRIHRDIGTVFYLAGRYDQAIQALTRALELDRNYPLVHYYLGVIDLAQENYNAAIDRFLIERGRTGATHPYVESSLAAAYWIVGDRTNAETVSRELVQRAKDTYLPATARALMQFAAGKRDSGFQWLEQAYQERDIWLPLLNVDPRFKAFRSDPRFIDLLARMNLDRLNSR